MSKRVRMPDTNAWTVEDWRDLWQSMEAVRNRIRERHGMAPLSPSGGPVGRLVGAAAKIVNLWDLYQADDNSVSPHDYFQGQDFADLAQAVADVHRIEAWAITLGTSRNYRRNSIAAVKAAFAWGARMGLLESDPVVRTPKPPPERRRAIPSRTDVDKLLEATEGTAFGQLVRVLADTGCRLGDAASLESRHVRWSERIAVLDSHKTDRATGDKVVPLTPRVLELLRDLADRYPDGTLLRTTRGNAWSTSSAAHEFVHWRQRLELPASLTAHGIRHRFVTDATRVLPRPVVAALLGYASTEVIDRIYDHSPDEVRESAAAMTAALDAVSRDSAGSRTPSSGPEPDAGTAKPPRPEPRRGTPRRRPGRG